MRMLSLGLLVGVVACNFDHLGVPYGEGVGNDARQQSGDAATDVHTDGTMSMFDAMAPDAQLLDAFPFDAPPFVFPVFVRMEGPPETLGIIHHLNFTTTYSSEVPSIHLFTQTDICDTMPDPGWDVVEVRADQILPTGPWSYGCDPGSPDINTLDVFICTFDGYCVPVPRPYIIKVHSEWCGGSGMGFIAVPKSIFPPCSST